MSMRMMAHLLVGFVDTFNISNTFLFSPRVAALFPLREGDSPFSSSTFGDSNDDSTRLTQAGQA